MIDRTRATWNGQTVCLHRCATCWADGPHAGANNGFIQQVEKIVHAVRCPEARPLPIVQPQDGLLGGASEQVKRLFARMAPGSVAVAKRDGSTGKVWVYYEGGIYTRATPMNCFRAATGQEREDYAKCAAGRAAERYPTTAFFVLDSMEGLEVVGEVDVDNFYAVRFFGASHQTMS